MVVEMLIGMICSRLRLAWIVTSIFVSQFFIFSLSARLTGLPSPSRLQEAAPGFSISSTVGIPSVGQQTEGQQVAGQPVIGQPIMGQSGFPVAQELVPRQRLESLERMRALEAPTPGPQALAARMAATFTGDIVHYFEKKVMHAQLLFGQMVQLFMGDLFPFFTKDSYLELSKLDFITSGALKREALPFKRGESDAAVHGQGSIEQAEDQAVFGILRYDFGYPASGPVEQGFKGLHAEFVSDALPFFLHKPFLATFKKMKFKEMILISPLNEFWLKLLMLAGSYNAGFMVRDQFDAEFSKLVIRLQKTNQFTSFEALEKELPANLMMVVKRFFVDQVSLYDFLKKHLAGAEVKRESVLTVPPVTEQEVESVEK